MAAETFLALSGGVVESPSLASDPDAYELKFVLSTFEATRIEAWARHRFQPDPHGQDGTYQTTTLYLDTPWLDVYHKSPGHRRSKYRLRRYGAAAVVQLERKKRRGDRVRKRRETWLLADLPRLLDTEGDCTWFGSRIQARGLQPVCCIGYDRTAFAGRTPAGPVRLTLDRQVVGRAASGWSVPAFVGGRELLKDEAVLELKFRLGLPRLFRELLATLPPQAGRGSKYRRCVEAWDLARGEGQCPTG